MDVAGLVSTYRRGLRFGMAGEGTVLSFGTDNHRSTEPGSRFLLFFNLGVSRLIDVRVAPAVTLLGGPDGFIWGVGGEATVRFNFLSFYAVAAGGYGGYLSWAGPHVIDQPITSAAFGAIEVSPAIFRFGVRREFEAGLMFGTGRLTIENVVGHFASAGFGYLFL
jgi:hypothetical protein